ncbi:hypothetical protein Aduo_002036 [Ancylostoma duodenale]
MTLVAGASSKTVELKVRCAFQTSKDFNVMCPMYWTIRHLKEHLHQVCPSHPDKDVRDKDAPSEVGQLPSMIMSWMASLMLIT